MSGMQQMFFATGSNTVVAVTFNPADKATEISLSGGNLIAGRTAASGWKSVRATLARASGKYYCEFLLGGSSGFAMFGLVQAGSTVNDYPGSALSDVGYLSSGDKYSSGTLTAGWGASYSTGDVLGIAYNATLGLLWFSKNNVWQGGGSPNPATNADATASLGAGASRFPMVSLYQDATSRTWTGHFAVGDLTYSPPSGFSPWQ